MGTAKNLILLIVAIVVVLSAIAFGFHWYKGASASDAARMTIDDARVALHCPNKPHRVLDFVKRTSLEDFMVRLGKQMDVNWVNVVCNNNIEG